MCVRQSCQTDLVRGGRGRRVLPDGLHKCWGAGLLREILLQTSKEAVSVTHISSADLMTLILASQDNLISILQLGIVSAELSQVVCGP